MAKKKNPWEGMDDAEKAAKKSIKKNTEADKKKEDGKRVMVRTDENTHAIVKLGASLKRITMENFLKVAVAEYFKSEYPELYKAQFEEESK